MLLGGQNIGLPFPLSTMCSDLPHFRQVPRPPGKDQVRRWVSSLNGRGVAAGVGAPSCMHWHRCPAYSGTGAEAQKRGEGEKGQKDDGDFFIAGIPFPPGRLIVLFLTIQQNAPMSKKT